MNIYADIDSLFDTRIAVIETIDKKASAAIATKKDYFGRLNDSFVGIDSRITNEVFSKYWEQRDKIDHNLFSITQIPINLFAEQQERLAMKANGIDIEADRLIVNTYPYVFSKEERVAMMKAISEFTTIPEVEFKNLLPEFLTPTFFRTNYRQVIIYDLNQWLDLHIGELEGNSLFDIRFITPLNIKGKATLKIPVSDLVEQSREHLSPFLQVNFLPLGDYCFTVE